MCMCVCCEKELKKHRIEYISRKMNDVIFTDIFRIVLLLKFFVRKTNGKKKYFSYNMVKRKRCARLNINSILP